jgi:hypothetical protein
LVRKTPKKEDQKWTVEFHPEFVAEYRGMDSEAKKALLAAAGALKVVGPSGGRPLVGTLDNPRHPNMKELRYDAGSGTQVWRAVFAFDPTRTAIVLVAGDKQGADEEEFYKKLLVKANRRFDDHLNELKQTQKAEAKSHKTKAAKKPAGKGKKGNRS